MPRRPLPDSMKSPRGDAGCQKCVARRAGFGPERRGAPAPVVNGSGKSPFSFLGYFGRMYRVNFSRTVTVCVLGTVAGCATPPSRINDICAVFDQRDGWVTNWRSSAQRVESKYGVPVPILMATVRKESGFKGNARPPRRKLLGFIPWKRQSSAYGYSQALDGTWSQYVSETGNWSARRTNFADSVDFVGWYHSKSADTLGIARNDPYNLYLAYYFGWSAYKRGDWRSNSGMQNYARDTANMANTYAAQLQSCR